VVLADGGAGRIYRGEVGGISGMALAGQAGCRLVNMAALYFAAADAAQAYAEGGIETGPYGETRVKGLYACGEAASIAVSGGEETFLPAEVTGARRTARHLAERTEPLESSTALLALLQQKRRLPPEPGGDGAGQRIGIILREYAGPVRTAEGLKQAETRLRQIRREWSEAADGTLAGLKTGQALTVDESIVEAALYGNPGSQAGVSDGCLD
jgi:succinate dehydrogenase/fumarate reductase flavoprotein subunit